MPHSFAATTKFLSAVHVGALFVFTIFQMACSGQADGGTLAGTGGRVATGGVAGSGGSENGGSGGGRSSGGSGDVGGAGGTAGSSATGGAIAVGGSGVGGTVECGPCPGLACQAPVELRTFMEAGLQEEVSFHGVSARGTGPDQQPLELECVAQGCEAVCQSYAGPLADGDYSVLVEAPGYQSRSVDFQITNPTNCGCCGCCPGSAFQEVRMIPKGIISGDLACCANLENDGANCGACGHSCEGRPCRGGECQ